ncbi:MAG: lytic murein transglycosylase B [Gammaproteobacteria bacterium]
MWTNVKAVSNLPFNKRLDVKQFINYLVEDYHFNRPELEQIFSQIKPLPVVIRKTQNAKEKQPWYAYRPIFLNNHRISAGLSFWQAHESLLQSIEQKYGVPASVLVAIVGVESFYGARLGKYNVLNALATLAFDYPSRQAYFKRELVNFLLLTREQHLDPFKQLGSRTGAMGQPQFMPSSYRHYAVDYSHDGSADLQNNTADVLASVANFLALHGWKRQQPIAQRINMDTQQFNQLPPQERQPRFTLADLKRYNINYPSSLNPQTQVNVIQLEDRNHDEYWLGFHNFYVIRRYNNSALYAMAVYQLANELATLHAKQAS